jgi:hypothetical protein
LEFWIKHLSRGSFELQKKKKRSTAQTILLLALVVPTGQLSNFLEEDFDAVLKFMNAEQQFSVK